MIFIKHFVIFMSTVNPMTKPKKHYYQKRCRYCKDIYFTSLISKDQYNNLAGNPYISYELHNNHPSAVIQSTCDSCNDKITLSRTNFKVNHVYTN